MPGAPIIFATINGIHLETPSEMTRKTAKKVRREELYVGSCIEGGGLRTGDDVEGYKLAMRSLPSSFPWQVGAPFLSFVLMRREEEPNVLVSPSARAG